MDLGSSFQLVYLSSATKRSARPEISHETECDRILIPALPRRRPGESPTLEERLVRPVSSILQAGEKSLDPFVLAGEGETIETLRLACDKAITIVVILITKRKSGVLG